MSSRAAAFFALALLLLFSIAAVAVATSASASSTSVPLFRYSEKDLETCVREIIGEEEASSKGDDANNADVDDDSSSSSCLKLYNDFLKHYLRPAVSSSSSSSLLLSPGYVHFTKTARLVHQHNTGYPNNIRRHTLRLNQFADDTSSRSYSKRDPTFVVHNEVEDEEEDEDDRSNNNNSNNKWQIDLENFWETHMDDNNNNNSKEKENDEDGIDGDNINNNNNNDHRSRLLRWEGTDVRLLDTPSSIRVEKEHQQQQQTQQQEEEPQLRRQSQQQYQQYQQQQQQQQHRSLKWMAATIYDDEPPPLSSVLRIVAASKHHTTEVLMPGDGTNLPAAFSSPQVPAMIYGTEVELHKGGDRGNRMIDDLLVSNGKVVNDGEIEYASSGESESKTSTTTTTRHEFSTKLNWSTTHNPDGVPLVHEVFDQGPCGSCWAFAATGSVEASAARNAARDYFVTGLAEITQKIKGDNNNNGVDYDDDDYDDDDVDRDGYYTLLEELTKESRQIESDTFEELNLSIQELLDCDTSVDEGCIGGNPLLAFYYIHKHGLVPWKEYPYVGYGRTGTTTTTRLGYKDDTFPTIIKVPVLEAGESINPFDGDSLSAAAAAQEDLASITSASSSSSSSSSSSQYAPTCKKEKVTNPIATVASWGLLHKDHENLIQYALLYVGPVAVGINGADSSFINYGGGIFDSTDCDQAANHALLIVGYGEEDATNENGETETIRYWIARNSWGESWGENGFVRVKRGSGEKGVPGVCGIARSPSVALGGIYRPNRTDPLVNQDYHKRTTARYRKGKYITSYDSSASLHLQMRIDHPVCDSMFSGEWVHGCVTFANVYDNNQPIFLALICLLCALVAIIPLAVSLLRQHRAAVGNGSLFLEHYGDEDPRLSERSRSRSHSSSFAGTASERTHLLTLKDMYAGARKKEEETKRPRGRSIVMTSPEHDPFHLVPSSTFDDSASGGANNNNNNNMVDEEGI